MTLLSARGIKVHFPIRKGIFFERQVGAVKAVDGVDLDVEQGTTYGLVGESGCGKSTLGRALLRLEEPTEGTLHMDGVDLLSLRGNAMRKARRRMQMIFQDPMASLDPRQNVESILTEPLTAHDEPGGKSGNAARVRELLDWVGLPTSALGPDLIVADEPVSALDVSVQAQVVNLLEELQDRLGLTYVVIAHDLAVVRHISDTVGVMYLGGIVEDGPADSLYRQPLHPYTIALMSAVPIPDPEVEDTRERIFLTGDLPSPADPPEGCRFHTRCPYRQAMRCDTERPALREVLPGQRVACHYAEQILAGTITPVRIEVAPLAADAVGDPGPEPGVPEVS